MPKIPLQSHLDLYAPQRKLALVASMEDLVEDQNLGKILEKFWSRVKKGSRGQCWQWLGAKARKGYGRFHVIGNRWYLAHRFSFLNENKRINPFLCVMHSCDTKGCVNPAHLSQGTILQNNREAWARQRMPYGERSGMSTIEESKVVAIRAEYARGIFTMREIAERFGVHNSQICRIVNYKSRRAAP